jgi:hypothetical protein
MADPVIGTLYVKPGVPQPPRYTQPGGQGTPVVPTQPPQPQPVTQPPYVGPPQEHLGRFFPGCGHSIMSYEVVYVAVGGVPSAALLCPMCGYVQNLYTPASLLDQQDIILG